MSDNPWRAPRLSYNAWRLMELLLRRGGGMRIGPLLRLSGMSHSNLGLAITELSERLWVDIIWRSHAARRPEPMPEPFRGVRRIATTRTGRHCYRYVPKLDGPRDLLNQ